MRPSTFSACARRTVIALGLVGLVACGAAACSPSAPAATPGATAPPATPTPSAVGGTPSPPDSAVTDIELATPTTGWGLTSWSSDPTHPAQRVIRSTDGGHGWAAVTPPGYAPSQGFL